MDSFVVITIFSLLINLSYGVGEVDQFVWSYAGPIAGKKCVQWIEPSDPHAWHDNYLCSDLDWGLKWSNAGAISGMKCTQILEPSDPHTWNDNYFCTPNNSPIKLTWSYAGSGCGEDRSVQIIEPSDPNAWHDNYLCYSFNIEYRGCYKDTSTRALRYGPMQYGYNQASCADACRDYKYFALQNGGWCSCDNSWPSVARYGAGSGCPASGLGAGWLNDVYLNRIQSVGCFRDTSSRALRYGPMQYGYDINSCTDACDGYLYFALQNNGWCSCDNDLTHTVKYGPSTGCPSSGAGGGWANNLYVRNEANVDSLGCYRDTSSRALRYGPMQYGYTIASCRDACSGYTLFALQNNGWCSCENVLSHAIKYGTSTGCPSSGLGGGWANNLYIRSNDVASLDIPMLLSPHTDDPFMDLIYNDKIFQVIIVLLFINILCIAIYCWRSRSEKKPRKHRYKVVSFESTDNEETDIENK